MYEEPPTADELTYIEMYAIPDSKLFFAAGRRGQALKDAMRDADAWIAYGAIPCEAHGHTLRTRAGHCFPCNPKNLSFLKRHTATGFVYVAQAGTSDVFKIGQASDLAQRIGQLRAEGYGGFYNWRAVRCRKTGHSGRIESALQRLLDAKRSSGDYLHTSGVVEARELFRLEAADLAQLDEFFFSGRLDYS